MWESAAYDGAWMQGIVHNQKSCDQSLHRRGCSCGNDWHKRGPVKRAVSTDSDILVIEMLYELCVSFIDEFCERCRLSSGYIRWGGCNPS